MQEQYMKEYREKYPVRRANADSMRPIAEERYLPPPGYSDHVDHHRNFINAVRSRKPVVEDAVFGFRAAGPALLSNVSYFEQRVCQWDPETMTMKAIGRRHMTAALQVHDLHVDLDGRAVLSDISFDLASGSILGLFGEFRLRQNYAGSRAAQAVPRGAVPRRGRNSCGDRDVLTWARRDLQQVRGGVVSLVFQDPALALNPVMRVRDQVGEVLRAHGMS